MYLKPLKIKNLNLKGNLFLAPMAEITNYPFRSICLRNGCDMVISEMISAKALHYKNPKSLSSLKIRDDKPICLQIFGSEPSVMLEAAIMAEEAGADMVEINAGCPVKKIVKTGAGSALMKNPMLLGDIINTLSARLKIPLSVKIRIGINDKEKNALMLARVIEESGASMIHIHLRTIEQHHSGDVDYETAKAVKSSVKIPFIANGGVVSGEKALEMFEKTGCDGISIGRGAISNPFIFDDIKNFLSKGQSKFKSVSDRLKSFIEYLEISSNELGERNAIVKARRIAGMWISSFKNASDIRNRFMKAQSLAEAKEILGEILNIV